LTKRVYELDLEGRRDRGRLWARWLDGVKKVCDAVSLELRDPMVKCMDRE